MRSARALAGAAAALLLAFAAIAQDTVPVPKLAARVTDLTGTLSTAQRDSIEQRLRAFEEAKGSQVAVLLVPTLGPETIEEFAGRVADTWQLGRKGVDDGVLNPQQPSFDGAGNLIFLDPDNKQVKRVPAAEL